MTKYIAVFAAVFGVGAGQALAAERSSDSAAPVKLTDGQLDDVVAGDPLIFVNVAVAAPISVHVEPITVSVPVNVAAIVQANILGNAVMDAVAVGTQNVFQAASGWKQPGG